MLHRKNIRTKNKSIARLTLQIYAKQAWKAKLLLIPALFTFAAAVVMMNFVIPIIQANVLEKIADKNFDINDLWGSFSSDLLYYAFYSFLSGVLLWRLNVWIMWTLQIKGIRELANNIFQHLITLDADFHNNKFTGSLVSQANKLIYSYDRFMDSFMYSLYTLVISFVATIIILTPIVPVYVGVLVVLSVLYVYGVIYFSKPVLKANTLESEQESKQTGQLADSLTNIMAVKSFASESFEKSRYRKETDKSYETHKNSLHKTTVRETFASINTTTIGVVSLVIAVFGTRYFGVDIGSLFLIVNFTGNIGQRLWEFQNVLRTINKTLGDASDMVKILQIKPKIQDPENPEEFRVQHGKIEIQNMEFKYSDSDKSLFKNFDLRIKAGEKVGLVGRSGSGKTSLTSLLLRFSDVNDGTIKVDGQDIRNVNQIDLRSHITYVPQEPLLFHRSLRENIAYSRPDASMQEIEAIAKMAHAHEFIKDLPKGYDTLVGERGVKLSGGQRQRVAIARSMLKNAPILLLDEATSALDSESEVLIQDALWKLMEGKTAIVIAHRLSTIQKMDRILVMDKGRIIEEGSHKELVRNKGKYAELWAHQSGGFLEDE